MKTYYQLPPCPDPRLYVLVQTREGCFWRRKPDPAKKARLNPGFRHNVSMMSMCSPLARTIARKLSPFTIGLDTGRLQGRLTAALMDQYKYKRILSLASLPDFELQPRHSLDSLVHPIYQVKRDHAQVGLFIAPKPGSVEIKNTLVSGYFFDAVLLYGDLHAEHSLRTEVQTSGYYPLNRNWQMEPVTYIINGTERPALPTCDLRFELPSADTDFALFLKVSCLEGNQMAVTTKNYGMKAVSVNEC